MMMQLAEVLSTRPFSVVVELAAANVRREAELLEIASNLANLPEVVAGSIPAVADTRAGQDPLRVACAVRARGLQPHIHLTCAQRERAKIPQALRELRALGLFNLVARTGLVSAAADGTTPAFDAVQLTEMIASARAADGTPFHISVCVSPFVYTREDLLAQYARLERKVAAGANLAITRPGWDVRKFAELKRQVDERGLRIPLMGNVHVISRRTADQMAGGTAAGPRVPADLLETLKEESEAPDGGLQARLERAARTIAVLKGLGYAGVYICGTHSAEQISEILRLSATFDDGWERSAETLQFGEPGGFYLETPAWS